MLVCAAGESTSCESKRWLLSSWWWWCCGGEGRLREELTAVGKLEIRGTLLQGPHRREGRQQGGGGTDPFVKDTLHVGSHRRFTAREGSFGNLSTAGFLTPECFSGVKNFPPPQFLEFCLFLVSFLVLKEIEKRSCSAAPTPSTEKEDAGKRRASGFGKGKGLGYYTPTRSTARGSSCPLPEKTFFAEQPCFSLGLQTSPDVAVVHTILVAER